MAKNEKFIYKTAQNVGINGAPVTMLAYFQRSCRALEWHSRGQRFDPAYLHQRTYEKPVFLRKQAFFIAFLVGLTYPCHSSSIQFVPGWLVTPTFSTG